VWRGATARRADIKIAQGRAARRRRRALRRANRSTSSVASTTNTSDDWHSRLDVPPQLGAPRSASSGGHATAGSLPLICVSTPCRCASVEHRHASTSRMPSHSSSIVYITRIQRCHTTSSAAHQPVVARLALRRNRSQSARVVNTLASRHTRHRHRHTLYHHKSQNP
jgi:hypothetical protein